MGYIAFTDWVLAKDGDKAGANGLWKATVVLSGYGNPSSGDGYLTNGDTVFFLEKSSDVETIGSKEYWIVRHGDIIAKET